MSDFPKSLGDYFARLEIKESERDRIVKAISEKKLPYEILKRFAATTKPFEFFQKKEKIPGSFRGAMYLEKALPRIIRYLELKPIPHKLCWDIFRTSAISYVNKEFADLDKLLRETLIFPSNDREALSSICKRANNFGVSTETIRSFYELWWTERFEDIESILAISSDTKELKAENNLQEKSKEQIEKLQKDISAILHNQKERDQKIQALENHQAQIVERIEETKNLNVKASNEVKKTVDSFTKLIEEKLTQIDNRFKSNSERLKAIDQKLNEAAISKEIKLELKRIADETRTAVRNTMQAVTGVSKEVTTQINVIAETYESKYSSLKKDIQRIKDSHTSDISISRKTKSPLAGPYPKDSGDSRISSESDFINSWLSTIVRQTNSNIQYSQLSVLHSTILANNVLVGEETLAKTWIECLGWQAFSLNIAASPTWTTEEDWADGLSFLAEASFTNPRILLIHNYDVALVDAFLVPSLKLWNIKNDGTSFSKIFLIPSSSNEPINPSVIEFSSVITMDDSFMNRIVSPRTGERIPAPVRGEIQTGVEPRIVAQWLQKDSSVDFDFITAERILGFKFPPEIVSKFRATASFASRFVTNASALESGFHHSVLPWVQAKYGDGSYNDLNAYLKQIAEVSS